VCPILMRQDGTRAGRPPNRSRGRRPGNKNSFRLRAPLSDCYGSRRCRRCGGGAVVGGGPSSFSNCWDAPHCQQALSRDHAGDGRSAVRGALARHMTGRLRLGRDLRQ
jgi:hypothetical protein